MGFEISWIGVQRAIKERTLERLGVRDTGEPKFTRLEPVGAFEAGSSANDP